MPAADILRAYRTATEGATHIGLLLAVYDALAEDLILAGEAAARNDLGSRCRYSEHAFLLLGHLESWVPLLEEPALEQSILCFYQYVRGELLRLQASRSKDDFAKLAMTICETRATWQKKQASAFREPHGLALSRGTSEELPELQSTGELRLGWSV
jgi:flagellin-specific chaperone FliS